MDRHPPALSTFSSMSNPGDLQGIIIDMMVDTPGLEWDEVDTLIAAVPLEPPKDHITIGAPSSIIFSHLAFPLSPSYGSHLSNTNRIGNNQPHESWFRELATLPDV